MRAKRRQRGMSLIELLVVMVILVVGIFTIVRVFPQGFRFITHARNQTQAARLAQGEVERWKAFAENVPDGIEAEDPATGEIMADFNPNDMGNATGVPANELWQWSNVNRMRLVRGETTVIPSPTLLPYGTGGNYAFAIYNLKFAPVEFQGEGANSGRLPPGYSWPDQYVLIYSDPMPRLNVTELNSDEREGTLDDLERQAYAIDYDSGTLYFQATWGVRRFKVDYNYWEGGRLHNETEIVTVDSGVNFPDPLPDTPVETKLAHKPDPYSEQVARKFDYVKPGEFHHWDAYQFTLLNSYSSALTFAPTIGFNPVGANRTVRTNLGPRPLKAHIDYEVLDWHVIHEDRTVPSPSQPDPNGYAIRLTLPGIKVAGRRYSDLDKVGSLTGSPAMLRYAGLTPGVPDYSVVALDLTDNTLMLDAPNGTNPSGALQVDYAAGIVTVPATVTKYTPFGGTVNQDIRGHDIRIFYQAVGDWAVQVTKAWSSYQRVDVPATVAGWASLQYNNAAAYVLAPGESLGALGYTNDSNRWQAVLVFPRKDAGHAVTTSLIWTDKDGGTHEVTGEQHQLPEFADLNLGYPYVVVPFAAENDYARPQGAAAWNNPNFTFIQGASLKVRTVWRENPHRWEVRDLETFLNRK